jgi:hypothetical protein
MAGRLEVKGADDKTSATITITGDDGSSATTIIKTDDLLRMIHALGAVYENLTKDRPQPVLEGLTIECGFDRRWYVQPALIGEAVVMSFHHPRFGPVGFLVPVDQAQQMSALLTHTVQSSAESKNARQ